MPSSVLSPAEARAVWVQELRSVSMEDICAEAVKAATAVLKAHGIERPAVVVNFAWKDQGHPATFAVGSKVPKRHRRMLADSLAQSAEECS